MAKHGLPTETPLEKKKRAGKDHRGEHRVYKKAKKRPTRTDTKKALLEKKEKKEKNRNMQNSAHFPAATSRVPDDVNRTAVAGTHGHMRPPVVRRPIQQSWDFASCASIGGEASRAPPTARGERARRWCAANQFGSGGGGGPPGSRYVYAREFFEAAQSEGRARLAAAVMEGHHARCL